jgi:hypothetical protein
MREDKCFLDVFCILINCQKTAKNVSFSVEKVESILFYYFVIFGFRFVFFKGDFNMLLKNAYYSLKHFLLNYH